MIKLVRVWLLITFLAWAAASCGCAAAPKKTQNGRETAEKNKTASARPKDNIEPDIEEFSCRECSRQYRLEFLK